ncbi:MAG: ATPase, T2SS/T4P/T4SS family [Phycisphaerae bacterium]|nr:ATPase, T2SS/T4P/T4SS family [Phycisphaerae bacterium]
MPTITSTIEMGFYVSPVKLAVFVLGFLAWLPLLKWVNKDAAKVRTMVQKWTIAIFAAGAAGLLVWLITPLFIIGLLMYLISVGATAIVYIIHRNSTVDIYQKIFTAEHIKSLFVNEEKQVEKITKGLVFITANKNKAPVPDTKTPEFFGYKTSQEFFDDAIWRRAEYVLLTPADQQYSVQYVIDGVVTKQPSRGREEIEYFIHYLKNLADLDIEEHRKPQVGKFTVQKDGNTFAWEVTTAGTTAGEQIKLKAIAEYSFKMLPDLGLMPDQLEKLKSVAKSPAGVFLVTGPKKSGITTTFYALIRNHDPFLNNINTLEKRPAGEVPNITQNVFSLSDTGTTTYAKKFQSILRVGPDIVGVEHCEEKNVGKLVCAAARDGKIVYATFEATSTVEAVGKWINFVADRNAAIDCITGISNQRLVRKLCAQCRQPYEPNKELLRKHNIPAEKITAFYKPGEPHHKRGKPVLCPHCQGTGFYGRTAIFETIIFDDQIKQLLKQAKSMNDIAGIFRRARMLYLQEQAIRKVAEGITSVNEVIQTLSASREGAKKTQAKS